jgi:hypothetical protein
VRARIRSLSLAVAALSASLATAAPRPTPTPVRETCAAWAARQRDPAVTGPSTTDRNELYKDGGGLKALGGKYYAAQFPPGFAKSARRRVLVSLHGTGGSPEVQWSKEWRRVLPERGWGFLGVKYMDAAGAYDDDVAVYAHIKAMVDEVAAACDLVDASFFLAGFSRGSAQAFPVTYLDLHDRHLFKATAHNSGAWLIGKPMPPTLRGLEARHEDEAFAGGRFWMYCGERDREHGVAMCDEMQNARTFVEKRGGTVAALYRDKDAGHGGLNRNADALAALFTYFESLP